MKNLPGKSPSLPLLIVGMVAVLSGTAGLSGAMGWLPFTARSPADTGAPGIHPTATAQAIAVATQEPPAQMEMTGNARGKRRCAECGVIVAIGVAEQHDEVSGAQTTSARRQEITVRMADGTVRVIDDANPARWRTEERLMIIDGITPAGR